MKERKNLYTWMEDKELKSLSLSLKKFLFSSREERDEEKRGENERRKKCFLPGSFFSLFILFCLLS